MKVYVVLGYDYDWYEFESYLGAFRTKEKAQKFIDNDYWENGLDNTKYPEHEKYEIREEEI